MNLKEIIKAELFRLGFPVVGITAPLPPEHMQVYRTWIDNGYHADMAYLSTEQAILRRSDPRLILPSASASANAVVCVAMPYPNPALAPAPSSSAPHGRVAAYAWGADYHDVIPPRLNESARQIQTLLGKPVSTRAYTDTGPILERELAQAAGLGWIGKNTCLIIPGQGSFFLLGELFIHADADLEPDPTFSADRCGSCRRCIAACPTGCIQDNRTLDARRCISYQTIENKREIPAELRAQVGDWVFGCDICQQVCPWNQRFSNTSAGAVLQPRMENARPDLLHDLVLTAQEFNQKFRGSPLKRAKRRGYLRNVAVALGNSAHPDAVFALKHCLETEPEALVRRHAAWGLGKLRTPAAKQALEQALKSEPDADVQTEIHAAMQGTADD